MRFEKLTIKSQEALARAQSLAREHQHQSIEPLHVLFALLEQEDGVARPILEKLGARATALSSDVEDALSKLPKVYGQEPGQYLSQGASAMLDEAGSEADRLRDDYVSVEHLLLAMATRDDDAGRLLKSHGATRDGIYRALAEVRGSSRVTDQNPEEKLPGSRQVLPRPHRAGPQGRAGSCDRPRRRSTPCHTGSFKAHQE